MKISEIWLTFLRLPKKWHKGPRASHDSRGGCFDGKLPARTVRNLLKTPHFLQTHARPTNKFTVRRQLCFYTVVKVNRRRRRKIPMNIYINVVDRSWPGENPGKINIHWHFALLKTVYFGFAADFRMFFGILRCQWRLTVYRIDSIYTVLPRLVRRRTIKQTGFSGGELTEKVNPTKISFCKLSYKVFLRHRVPYQDIFFRTFFLTFYRCFFAHQTWAILCKLFWALYRNGQYWNKCLKISSDSFVFIMHLLIPSEFFVS